MAVSAITTPIWMGKLKYKWSSEGLVGEFLEGHIIFRRESTFPSEHTPSF